MKPIIFITNNLDTYFINYFSIFIYLFICFFISSFIFILSYMLIKKNSYVEKLIPYECGFEPYEDTRNIFNVQFYLVALLFLIFDLESLYLYPIVTSLFHFDLLSIYILIEFMLELLIGYMFIYKFILKSIIS
jgi:NADH-quinone oxidoreductase subunit A